jgi:hypothetical protein
MSDGKGSLWDADPFNGARFRDPADPDQMLLDLLPEPNLAPLGRILLTRLAQLPDQTATIDALRSYSLEHTIYRRPHTAPAFDRLLARRQITATPPQANIRSSTRGTVRVTATGQQQLDPFGT